MDKRITKRQTRSGGQGSALIRMLSFYDPYGWVAKLGLIVPASNTVNAHEWELLAPEGVSIHTARVAQSGRSSRASFEEMASATELAAQQLATASVDAVGYGCTSGSFMTPRTDVMNSISQITGCPATNSADAALAALRALGATRVALATPYMDYIHECEITFLEEEGISVTGSLNLGLGETEEERFAIRKISPKAAFQMALAVDTPDTEAIFLSCTSMASVGSILEIEAQLGKPVVTSNQATLWHLMQLLNLRFDIPAGGRLMNGSAE